MKKSGKTLSELKCVEGAKKLPEKRLQALLAQVPGWNIEGPDLMRRFTFKDFFETMSAVTAIAMLAQQENHHPDMEVGYNKLNVRFSTHSAG